MIILETYCIRVVYRIVGFGDFPCRSVCCTLVVVVIGEDTCRFVERSINLGFLFGEVARVALFIPTGVGGVGIVLIILRSVAADKRPAAFEHIHRRGQYRACVPIIITQNGLQGLTIEEHKTHIRHFLCIERTQVKRREFFTVIEHPAHIRNFVSHEIFQTFYLRYI